MFKDKLLFLQASLYVVIGALTPVGAILSGVQPLTTRVLLAMVVTAVVGGAVALKAFLSTTFADSSSGKLSRA